MSQLPPFLVRNGGVNSGFMIAQVTAAALASENKALSHPHSVDSLPTSAGRKTMSLWLRLPGVVCGKWHPIPVACWPSSGWQPVRGWICVRG